MTTQTQARTTLAGSATARKTLTPCKRFFSSSRDAGIQETALKARVTAGTCGSLQESLPGSQTHRRVHVSSLLSSHSLVQVPRPFADIYSRSFSLHPVRKACRVRRIFVTLVNFRVSANSLFALQKVLIQITESKCDRDPKGHKGDHKYSEAGIQKRYLCGADMFKSIKTKLESKTTRY